MQTDSTERLRETAARLLERDDPDIIALGLALDGLVECVEQILDRLQKGEAL